MSVNPIVPTIVCAAPVLHAGEQGIERIAVDDAGAQLVVTFFRTIVLPAESYLLQPASYTLTGGRRLFPRVTAAALQSPTSPPLPGSPRQVILTLDTIGDFSVYTLTVSGPDIDPLFAGHKLRFRLNCDDRFDCRPAAAPLPAQPEIPVAIDYLAKDYSSFRQALLDFAGARFPDWTERSEADIGMMLLELFSYTADRLSYMQDRVAGEAYLSTATQRRSVAQHLQLIGYRMDEGASAFTWLQFQVSEVHQVTPALQVSSRPKTLNDSVAVFEPLASARLDPAHNAMPLYTWGNTGCCLPRTALGAAVRGAFPHLAAGDYVLIDDRKGHRDVVRLSAAPVIATEPDGPITSMEWAATTPLHFDYCADDVVVSGNLVVATHGETIAEPERFTAPPAAPSRLRLRLARFPLARLDAATLALVSASGQTLSADSNPALAPRGISSLSLTVGDDPAPWQEAATLLDSEADAKVYRLEIDDEGEATVVFGQGGSGGPGEQFGLRPPAGDTVQAVYRVGGGAMGNVGADTLVQPHASPLDALTWLISVTNPLPATGGRDLETRDAARRFAPHAFQKPLVAVTAQDYELAARQFTDSSGRQPVARAKASFRWTGSWLTVALGLDLQGGGDLTADLKTALLAYLDTRRLAGYDLEVKGADYVPIEVAVSFCPAPGVDPAKVQQQIELALSNGPLGFFSPDNFSFGDSVYTSRIFAAVIGVAGVESARITRLARLHAADADAETALNLSRGFMAMGPNQILRLDNDRNFPENGALAVANLEAGT